MSIKELLFSFQGRIGRKTYWVWNIIYYIMILGFGAGISKLFPAFSYILLPIFLLILLIPDLAITTKRWHDRNKSIYWLGVEHPIDYWPSRNTNDESSSTRPIDTANDDRFDFSDLWPVDFGGVWFLERYCRSEQLRSLSRSKVLGCRTRWT